MNTTYNCNHTYEDGENAEWEIEVRIVDVTVNTMEVIISGRGSEFDVIVVKNGDGRFLCIPELNEGCQLGGLLDFNWNFEKLSAKLNETDAVTIAMGLYTIGKDIEAHNKTHSHEVK